MTLPDQQMSEEEYNKPRLVKCSFDEYNKINALRSSDFKTFCESPLKYHDMCLTKQQKFQPTDAMRLGTILHSFILDGVKKYEVWPNRKQGNDWKQFKADCDERGVIVLQQYGKTDELHHIEMQIQAVTRCKAAVELFEKTAVREQTIIWNNQGVKSKARLDMWTEDGCIPDLKVTVNPKPREFFNQMNALGYHVSARWYELARDAFYGVPNGDYPFYWITVSSRPWYYCKVYEMDPSVREAADNLIRMKLSHMRMCIKHKDWSDSRFDKPEMLFAPDWFLKEHDDSDRMEGFNE